MIRAFTLSPRGRAPLAALSLSFSLLACAARPTPAPLSQADTVAVSPAVLETQELAPQAWAAAENLRQEARALHDEGKDEEAAIVAERATAAYERAVAVARHVRAQARSDRAKEELERARQAFDELEERQRVAQADADAYELRARVALDTEPVRDVDKLTPERALARQKAALSLASEARVLCLAAGLLDASARDKTAELQQDLNGLARDLEVGSVKVDLYPRAVRARSGCLKTLTDIRRPRTRKAPEAGLADRLLTTLSETKRLFVFRDDRGVVVNLLAPLDAQGELGEEARELLEILGGVSRQNQDFPVVVVVHTAKAREEKSAEQAGKKVSAALEAAGARAVSVHVAGHAEPVVDPRVPGAATQNARVEIIFVTPAL